MSVDGTVLHQELTDSAHHLQPEHSSIPGVGSSDVVMVTSHPPTGEVAGDMFCPNSLNINLN